MITRLEIDGFKSLRDFSIDLEPFTVLVGPNSAGKSNVLEALALLSRLASMPIAEALRGGRGRALDQFTRRGGEPARTMRLAAEMLVLPDAYGKDHGEGRQTRLRYEVTLERHALASGVERVGVADEQLLALDSGHDPWVDTHPWFRKQAEYESNGLPILRQLGRTPRGRRVTQDPTADVPTEARIPETHTALGWLCGDDGIQRQYRLGTADAHPDAAPPGVSTAALGGENTPPVAAGNSSEASTPTAFANLPAFETFVAARELERARIINLDPSKLRVPSERVAEGALARDASNLPTLLAELPPTTLGAIRSDLVSLVPGLSSVLVVSEDESFRIDFEFSGGESLPARLASDGTLRLLALLTILHLGPHSCLGIEEPETGVYPGRLRALLAFLEEHAERLPLVERERAGEPLSLLPGDGPRTQLLLTTHSPVVLAALRSKPECLRFLDLMRRDGQLVTRARRVSPTFAPAQARDLVSLREVDRLLDAASAEFAEAGE